MSVYDDNVEVSSDSFWEIGQYKKTVKRVDDGFELCTRLMQLIQERADIEKGYSANLKKCTIRNRLVDNVQAELKSWQKENYHKSALPPQRLKNSKDLEDKFQKAQKPWAKQYKHVQDCKKRPIILPARLSLACSSSKQAAGDSAQQPEAIKKLSEQSCERLSAKVTKSRSTAYESAVADLDGQRSRLYGRAMSDVFPRTQ
uniref:FCH domain-containing protein n=1 Tax=Macrostomum lignano TaxID=282301 RepID=A0A1I8F1E8_9PLAT